MATFAEKRLIMNDYIATFYSHFGAIRYKKELEKQGTGVTLMPVPRSLSSSCGTCGRFTCEKIPTVVHLDEIEQIVRVIDENNYEQIYSAE